ncbi:MAG: helix-turn-helix domain-containing protein, partial [Myxococcota bacterium]
MLTETSGMGPLKVLVVSEDLEDARSLCSTLWGLGYDVAKCAPLSIPPQGRWDLGVLRAPLELVGVDKQVALQWLEGCTDEEVVLAVTQVRSPMGAIRLPGVTIRFDTSVAERDDGRVCRLSDLEVRLLRFLAAHPNRLWSNEDLLTRVWGYRMHVRTRTVSHTLHRIRKKIEPDPRTPTLLQSSYGRGLRLVLESVEPAAHPPLDDDLQRILALLEAHPGVPIDDATLSLGVWGALQPTLEVSRQVGRLRQHLGLRAGQLRRFPQATCWHEDSPTPLLGRSDDIAAGIKVLDEHRWVNLHGLPGVGKSTLALEFLQTTRAVVWISVRDATEVGMLRQRVAQTFGVHTESIMPVLQFAAPRIILDAVENIGEDVVGEIRRWL